MEPFYQNPELKKKRVQESVSRVFAGVGLIVVLVAAGYVGFEAIARVPSLFSGASTGLLTGEKIVVTATPTTIDTGATTTLSWVHEGKKQNGSYTFVYDCAAGLSLTNVTDEKEDIVFCNVPFHFTGATSSLLLRAESSTDPVISTNVSIEFTANGASRVSERGETRLTVTNPDLLPEDVATSTSQEIGPEQPGNVQGVSVTQGPRTVENFGGATTTAPRTSNPNGTLDLALTILAVGVANEDSGDFTAATGSIDPDTLSSHEVLAVKFQVENLGSKESGDWEFEAELPTRPRNTFHSRHNDSLFPGERIEFVLGFDREQRNSMIEVDIAVDPDNDINEVSEANNNLTAKISLDL